MKRPVILLFAFGAALAATIVVRQSPYASSRFDYGRPSTIEGEIRASPVPLLSTAAGPVLLVAQGKHGAIVKPGPARVTGPLIARERTRMLEIHDVTPLPSQSTPPAREILGIATYRGEIVDSKCWLGVMNPGEKKVHRACASLCIRGGVPAMLVSGTTQILLTGETDLLPYVAEPVEVTGELTREAGVLAMKVMRVRRV